MLPDDELSIIFVNESTIAKLNCEYLNHHGPTDVITFDYLGGKKIPAIENDQRTIGEIYICCDLAERAAVQHNNEFSTEIILYIVHGILHLCGYNDLVEADIQKMRSKEKEILSNLNDEFELTNFFKVTAAKICKQSE